MAKARTTPFELRGIQTHQFAIIDDSFDDTAETMLQVGVNVGASDEAHIISIFFEIRFLSNDRPFILLEIECQFDIAEKAYESLYTDDKESLIVPMRLCDHLGIITVGTARGILYEKLKDTEFDELILPTINLTEHFTEDIVLNRAG
ncbi:MAG: hypothetical protein Roseis2KO_41410 [Roseivirga sp.]